MGLHPWQDAFSPNCGVRARHYRGPLFFLLGFTLLGATGLLYIFVSDIKSVTDDMGHHLYSRYFWRYPELMLNQWQRPLYTLLTAGPALFGYRMHCLSSVVFSLSCCGFTIAIARHYGLKNTALIPVIMATTPAFVEIFWTTLSEPPFAALLSCALWCHVKGFHGAATTVTGFLPLVRPEGGIVMMIWIVAYLWHNRRKYLPLILLGAAFWLVAAWAITGDVLYPLRASYRFSPGLRGIQWDYVLKFYDDFSGPLWFVSATVGLIAWRGTRLDLVHVVYLGIFMFFMFLKDNLEDLPPGHFGWRFMAPLVPLFALYALKGSRIFIEGWRVLTPISVKSLRLLLLTLGFGWTAVATIYFAKGNAYSPTLLSLAVLGDLSIFLWLWEDRWSLRLRRALFAGLVIISLGYTLWKVPFYRAGEMDIAVRQLAQWWLSDPRNEGLRVNCALLGFYYYAGLDPVYNQKSEGALPGIPGGIVIWDSWAFGRWGRLSYLLLEENGYLRVPCPVTPTTFDLRVYRRPNSKVSPDERISLFCEPQELTRAIDEKGLAQVNFRFVPSAHVDQPLPVFHQAIDFFKDNPNLGSRPESEQWRYVENSCENLF
jgi:hypothetical protein